MTKKSLPKIIGTLALVGASVIGGNYVNRELDEFHDSYQAMSVLGEIAGEKVKDANTKLSTLYLLNEIATSPEYVGNDQ